MTVLVWEFSAEALLAIAKPVSANNIKSLVIWRVAEGSNAAWNLWDSERQEVGDTDYNKVGVKNYDSQQQGIDAFKATILNGDYPQILQALENSELPPVTCSYITNSRWGSKISSQLVADVLMDYDKYANEVVPGSTPSDGLIGDNVSSGIEDATGQDIPAAIVDGFPAKDGQGWYAVGADGTVYAQDGAVSYGSYKGPLNKPIVAGWSTSTGRGYVLLAADGGTFNFGDGDVPAL